MSTQAVSAKNHALLEWHDGQPYSAHFGDVYFSRESGLEETRHVFLRHNRLAERLQALQQSSFTIVETGFGTGLSFLCAWQLWEQTAPAEARLHFVSIEKFPLSHADLARALDLWPELRNYSSDLLSQYHQLIPGWQRLVFANGRVQLTLLIGDVLDILPQINCRPDAWFLDGFAPSRNPEMWQEALFTGMAACSDAQTTFATFTSAGLVKRGLQAAGFEVHKVAGHGRKRDMLCGRFTQNERSISQPGRAVVIGGGIAGGATSRALAERGWQVTLLEQETALAQHASGNPVGVLYPKLARKDVPLGRLSLSGYLHSLRLLARLELDERSHARCGMLQLAYDEREWERCRTIAAQGLSPDLLHWVEADEASRLAGLELAYGALYFPEAAWVRPQHYCEALAYHPNITHKLASHVFRLQQTHHAWQAWREDKLLAEAEVVVIANAWQAASFTQSSHLPLEPVRGQVSQLKHVAGAPQLNTLLCTDGYISPLLEDGYCLGATFVPGDTAPSVREEEHAQNLAMLKRMAPSLHAALMPQVPQGRAAIRCTSPDYLPLVGPLLDYRALEANPPRHTADPASSLPWLPGLYINTAHGSKGLTTAPLAAEMLACAINHEPAPVDAGLLAALDPNRFVLRKLGLKRLAQGLACYPLR
ncbi:bifunctional tRNA (5-methylaminomethyl-2-thiouridine)(34)-methyltransferase MnmD/FAD-dependent 5-carboxymethylaminomethyl-2-thiouridine(34) oxidoreductase MnmC [Methylobacillus arboreus]|uniref:bifunctional tRNA (5-methylaminomethyl-2-thiouridine)(34)-methyltransferase MnmD/FAD-dependent 5-carboxymethylaminomethyl-2-thiouridine(34) oxidoreductase MnmC n=1 Tax=Methylobacillus arboreus TaxID=755170 RepID=UPI001E35D97D|nr:bifunctional tRNA (5-methylaminomethyl-2-thiouridine)(34)-methyltransferase MnmD/FAD-dependent 5-carboxymethylaminomethyl-2-thiouridine(34) oxidoreductase MnmC [Methylobacillus arboreus]MCB5189834.1 bifunctional tRNA (5-methylaminomethyl-2-thiouridine)(34)-methyltransferase MnmD/FAD-dependent 5-carboxymethylaminomethyl-2-thiouridine(34) oxidoreductase MnmC [Methylobacillus arboreus]